MTKAIILAAGLGKRLRPLTNNIPKCLVNLCGKSLLERQLDVLNKNGINNIHIAAGYKATKIKKEKCSISINKDYNTTNMVETLFSATDFFNNSKEDLIISYGDIVYNSKNLIKILKSNEEVSTMIDTEWKSLWKIRMENPLKDAETLILDKNNFILNLGQKTNNYETIQGQYTGLTKIRADKINYIVKFYNSLNKKQLYFGKKFQKIYMTDFLQLLIDKGQKINAILVKNGWLEIDTKEDLNLYENLHKKNKLDKFYKICV